MTEGQEWTIAWLVAGGIFIMVIQIVKWVYWLINKIKNNE